MSSADGLAVVPAILPLDAAAYSLVLVFYTYCCHCHRLFRRSITILHFQPCSEFPGEHAQYKTGCVSTVALQLSGQTAWLGSLFRFLANTHILVRFLLAHYMHTF
jgi:hypothetical protein